MRHCLPAATLLLLASGCSYFERSSVYYKDDRPPADRSSGKYARDAVPRVEPRSRSGNPKSYVVFGKRYHVMESSKGYVERGIASWYGTKFHGRRTSSGEIYNMHAMSAAHKTLPLPTYVEVTNIKTGKKIIVRVNDRGPFHAGRIIDLSYAAANKLGIASTGTGLVEVRAIDPRTWKPGSGTAPTRTADTSAAHPDASIYLQLGAFSLRENAEKLLERAVRSTISGAFIQQGSGNNGQTLYRVRVGPLASVEIADHIISRLLKTGFDEFHVVIE